MIINLNELNNSDNLEDGHPSNTLFMYHVTDDKDFTCFKPQTPQYRKLKNGEFTSLTLRIMDRSLRTPKGIKGTRQKVIVTHNLSEIDQAQLLEVKFPNLGSDDVIIPGTVNLSFNTELTSTIDANSNIGRAIMKKLAVKFEGNEIMSVDDYDIFACY